MHFTLNRLVLIERMILCVSDFGSQGTACRLTLIHKMGRSDNPSYLYDAMVGSRVVPV